MGSASHPLRMFFLPFQGPSHLIPEFEVARLFASRGQHVTIFSTPANKTVLQNTIDKDTNYGHLISLFVLPLPNNQVGLPEGVDFSSHYHDPETSHKLFLALSLLRPKIEEFIHTLRPNCIVSDRLYPWAADLALSLGIPHLIHHSFCITGHVLHHAILRPDSPHRSIKSDYDPFVIPDLPDRITMTRSRLPDFVRSPTPFIKMVQQWTEAESKSYAVLVNSFADLESDYTECYKNATGHNIFHVGPASLIHRNSTEKAERFEKSNREHEEILSWLNSKKPDSVLYVSFGSYCRFPDEQLMEIACGLEDSGHQFIWIVHGKESDEEEEMKNKWLPKRFEERLIFSKEKRGMIVRGWAPQVLILEHTSIGGFLTHCGWGSLIESVCAGVPMITWPLYADQFYNEPLVTQVLRIGIPVGSEDWNMGDNVGKRVIMREKIDKAVKMLMDGGDDTVKLMRQKIKHLGEVARKAIEDGGSSHQNLTVVIEELKQLRDQKAIL